MKTTMKAMGLMLAMSLLALWGAQTVQAAPDTDTDYFTITVTPSVDLGVDVDTTNAKFVGGDTIGSMNLPLAVGGTAYMETPAVVRILGNYNKQEIQLKAECLDSWTIDSDFSAEEDKVQVYALFAESKGSTPSEAEFDEGLDARHMIQDTNKLAGAAQGNEGSTNVLSYFSYNPESKPAWSAYMDDLAVNAQKELWLRVDAPPTSLSDDTQRIVVTLTAVNGKNQ